MTESTYFSIEGIDDVHHRSLRNVKGSKKWIEQVGENVRLADGTRVTLRRPQFLDKWSVTITGESIVPAPFGRLRFGDTITINYPHPEAVPGYVDVQDLLFSPIPFYCWYFGYVGADLVRLGDGVQPPSAAQQANVTQTMWVPRMKIMLDAYNTDYDDTTGRTNWTIEGEVA